MRDTGAIAELPEQREAVQTEVAALVRRAAGASVPDLVPIWGFQQGGGELVVVLGWEPGPSYDVQQAVPRRRLGQTALNP